MKSTLSCKLIDQNGDLIKEEKNAVASVVKSDIQNVIKYYIRVDVDQNPFDPLYDNLRSQDVAGMVWNWREVSKTAFEFYLGYLKTKKRDKFDRVLREVKYR